MDSRIDANLERERSAAGSVVDAIDADLASRSGAGDRQAIQERIKKRVGDGLPTRFFLLCRQLLLVFQFSFFLCTKPVLLLLLLFVFIFFRRVSHIRFSLFGIPQSLEQKTPLRAYL